MTGEKASRLDGRVALVTGAGRGIGRGCSIALAEAGANVVLMSRTAVELDRVSAEIRARGGAATTLLPCDVTDRKAVLASFAQIDHLDILVHAAGGNFPEPFTEVSEMHIDALLSLNVKSAYIVAQQAVLRMLAGGVGGTIVFVSSQMGHVGAANRTLYCATKHAVEGLMKALAVELAPSGIRVATVAPTFIETSMTEPYFRTPGFRDEVLTKIPLGRLGQVEDVSAAVTFLVSPAASLITGTSLIVDGGWTAS